MRKKIIIVDDEAIIRKDIGEILETSGYDIVGEASDGIDAVELCRIFNPDAVLLDIKLPIMDGLTAARFIHEENENIAIVMLTAYNDSQFVDKAAEYGVTGYLVKPLSENSLVPTVEISIKRSLDIVSMQRSLDEERKKLENRKIIDRAKGILMINNHLNEEDAYNYLRTVSMNKRMSIREVAQRVITTNEVLKGF